MVSTSRRDRSSDLQIMLSMWVSAILGGMVALIAYELVQEIRGGTHKLQDRYHE